MSGDRKEQIKQLNEHARAMRIDLEAAESAGAAVPGIHVAKELLDAAVKKAEEAIATKAEAKWMRAVKDYGCIVCRNQGFGFVPCAVHHLLSGGIRIGHLHTIGLCDPGHHQNAPKDSGQISRHPNKAAFEAAYGTEEELLDQSRRALGWLPALVEAMRDAERYRYVRENCIVAGPNWSWSETLPDRIDMQVDAALSGKPTKP